MLDNLCFVNWAELIRKFLSGLNKKKKTQKEKYRKTFRRSIVTDFMSCCACVVGLFVCSVYESDISVQ